MSEYADWLEKWATTEGMGIEPDEERDGHADGLLAQIEEREGCRLELEWSPDQWQYWCRSKCTATELLRIWEVLP